MITRLLTLLVLVCCFSSYSNAQTTNADGSITLDNQLGNSDFDSSVFSAPWNFFQNSNAGVGHTYANDKYVSLRDGGLWQTFGLPELLNPSNQVVLHWSLEVWKLDLQDLFEVRVGFGDGNQNPTDWASVLNLEGENTSGWETFSGNEIFNSISNNALTAGIWMEGKDRDGGSWASGRYPTVDDVRLSMTYFEGLDCSNPLNDPSCEGYQEAYTEQQCQQDPLYDQSCSGYEQAYLNQQCSSDPLYDPSCDGYESAYEDQQCSLDPLWSPKCSGYQMAYDDQQCKLDPQYSPMCFGYKFEEREEFKFESFSGFEDFSRGDTGNEYDAFGNIKEDFSFAEPEPQQFMEYERFTPVYEEEKFIFDEPFAFERSIEEEFKFEEPELEFTPELDEFIPEDIKEAIAELEKRIEEKEEEQELKEIFEEFVEEEFKEEIEEDVVVIAETTPEEVSESGGETQTRRSGSRVGLSVGLGTANSLVAGLITNSIESGNSTAAQGVGTGGYFESGTRGISTISNGGVSFGEFANTVTSDNQVEVETSIALPSVSVGISLDTQTVEIEVREPTLAERIAEKTRKKNLEAQGGIFSKQESVLSTIANGTNLTKYYDERLADADSFYVSEQVYKDVVLADNRASLWRMTNENYGLMNDLVRSQYGE